MIWSKIKKAINSTLGTSGFKPLDKIITDSFEEVVGKQNAMKTALESGENNFIVEFAKSSANIEAGSYIGTGTYGEKNPNSLTFSFVPKFIYISTANDTRRRADLSMVAYINIDGSRELFLIAGNEKAMYANDTGFSKVSVSWNGTTVSWYNPSDNNNGVDDEVDAQMNGLEATYRYIAIG